MKSIMKSTENCGVCGRPLVYGTEEIIRRCDYCGGEFPALIYCPEGHYVCDSCHNRAALDVLRDVLAASTGTDPAATIEKVMAHPAVPMHGPEHHAIVPAAIVAAVRNTGYPVPDGAVERAIERGSKVPGGWCGACGACGAGIGAGIAVSVITGATPLTGRPRSLANEMTALALSQMVDGGPRCCKRASRNAVRTAVEFLETKLGITLDRAEPAACGYVDRNKECIRKACPYYGEVKSKKAIIKNTD
jgi:hypothetical protein